jgi:hypothetical protein
MDAAALRKLGRRHASPDYYPESGAAQPSSMIDLGALSSVDSELSGYDTGGQRDQR